MNGTVSPPEQLADFAAKRDRVLELYGKLLMRFQREQIPVALAVSTIADALVANLVRMDMIGCAAQGRTELDTTPAQQLLNGLFHQHVLAATSEYAANVARANDGAPRS